VDVKLAELKKRGLRAISDPFDEEHKRLFTFALPLEHEFVALRAVVQGRGIRLTPPPIKAGKADPAAAAVGSQKVYMDGRERTATVYDRAGLQAGNRIAGPAIVVEMDSTTVVLPKHTGLVDRYGNILIYPDGHKALKGLGKPAARKPAKARSGAKAKTRATAKAGKKTKARK
jgi:N-methylhydantoinase A